MFDFQNRAYLDLGKQNVKRRLHWKRYDEF